MDEGDRKAFAFHLDREIRNVGHTLIPLRQVLVATAPCISWCISSRVFIISGYEQEF